MPIFHKLDFDIFFSWPRAIFAKKMLIELRSLWKCQRGGAESVAHAGKQKRGRRNSPSELKTYESVVNGIDKGLWRKGEHLLGQRRRQRPHQRTRLVVQLKAAVDFSMSTSAANYSEHTDWHEIVSENTHSRRGECARKVRNVLLLYILTGSRAMGPLGKNRCQATTLLVGWWQIYYISVRFGTSGMQANMRTSTSCPQNSFEQRQHSFKILKIKYIFILKMLSARVWNFQTYLKWACV